MNNYRVSSLIGNTTVLNILKRSVANRSIRRVATFMGVLGTGKSTSATAAALTLTCDSPVNNEACLECSVCRENIRALEKGADSRYIKSINMAKIDTKKGVNELLKDIFDLVPESRNAVYILNEFHALKELGQNAQTAFLDQFDRMSPNIYVFITTTHEKNILNTIISRSTEFRFNRLTDKESMLLIDMTCEKENIKLYDNSIKRMIISSCKGVPRDIIKSVKYIADNDISVQEYKEFVGIISDGDFLDLLVSMNEITILPMINTLDQLMEKHKNTSFIDQLKEFFLKCIYFNEAGITEDFDVDTETLKKALENVNVYEILRLLDRLNYRSTSADIKSIMYDLRNRIKGKTTIDVVKNSAKVASVEKNISNAASAISRRTSAKSPNRGLIDMDMFDSIPKDR